MMQPQRILIVSGSPDHLNSNAVLRHYVAEGFALAHPTGACRAVAYDGAIAAARQWRPDLVVVFGSVMIDGTDYYHLADLTRRQGGKLVFWLHDDPHEFDMNERIVPLADAIFTNDEASLDYFSAAVPVFHLPMGGSPSAHFRPVIQRSGPELFFCGHVFPNRQAFLAELRRKTPDFSRRVQLLGSGWEIADIAEGLNIAIPNATMPDYYAASTAVLNIGRDYDLANGRFAIRSSTPGPRTFEAAFAGAAQIYVGDGLEIADSFEPGHEILLADDVDSFKAHWERLAADPALSLALGRAAQARAQRDHGYDSRVATLLRCLA